VAEAVAHTEVIHQNYVALTLNEPVLHIAGVPSMKLKFTAG